MQPPPPTRDDITGLVLAGGRGSRMGGVDKGLQLLWGEPLAQHALRRLRPQVGAVWINANRHLDAYAQLGAPVCADPIDGYAGPLVGWLAGLRHCKTPWLLTVPCDTPCFPLDLAERLAQAVAADDTRIAIAATREGGAVQAQPVFCLLHTALHDALVAYLNAGGRKIDTWALQQGCATVVFDDAAAFFNANTAQELQALSGQPRG